MTDNDRGHRRLVADITELLREAEAGEFHDFRNEKYAAPKLALHQRLHELDQKMQAGEYDNR